MIMNDNYAIKNNIVALRPMTVDDTKKVIGWRNSPEVMKRFLDRNPVTEEIHLNWIKNFVQKGKVVQFIICVGDEYATEIGSTYLRNIDDINKSAEFGIFISGDHIGKGYGFQVLNLVLQYATEIMKMHKISLRVLEDNLPAISTYKKCGFVQEDYYEEYNDEGINKKVLFFSYVIKQ